MNRSFGRLIDWGLVSISVLIPTLGLIVLYSAGYDPDRGNPLSGYIEIHSFVFVKQLVFIVGGVFVMLLGALIPSEWLGRIAYPFYWICFGLLLWVQFFGVIVNGSKRWIDLGVVNLQPAELVKLGVILAMAKYLAKHPPPPKGYGFKELVVPMMILLGPVGLILAQPDLGSALSVAGVAGLMILFLGVRVKTIAIAVFVLAVAAYPIWEYGLHDYQKRRVMVLVNPGMDPKGSGWHIIQSKIAVGSGSFSGVGFMKGTQTQLEFLPEHTTDFIFSVLAEEWGFLGTSLILSLYTIFLFKILKIAEKSKDLFGTMLVIGVGAKFFFHITVNVGMVLGLLPVVGIPLPLFSYGGSSIMASMFGLGLILGQVIRRRRYV
jgi:rod shape determining protein RodA